MKTELQELAELEELEELAHLEALDRQSRQAPPKEEGLAQTNFSPTRLAKSAIDMLGGSSDIMGQQAVDKMTLGHAPELVGAVKTLGGNNYLQSRDAAAKQMERGSSEYPVSSLIGAGTGIAATAGAQSALAPINAATAAGRVGQIAKQGAGMGLLANPGRTEGELDPTQPMERLQNSALGAFISAIMGAGGELVKKGAQTARDISTIKSGGASELTKQEINKALKSIDQTQLAPRDAKLRELIKGGQYEVNPDMVEDTFPNLAKTMRGKLEEGQVRRPLSPERALRLKRAADSAANYNSSKAFDPSATAKVEEAQSLAGILRNQLNAQPGVREVNSEMADILAKKSALSRGARNAPISSIRAQPGTDKDSLVKAVDKLAGSDLEGLDNRIGSAKDLLLHPTNLVKPLEFAAELRKTGTRGAVELSRALEKLPPGSTPATLNAILNAKKRER